MRPRASCLPRRRQALDGTCGRRLSSSLPLLLVVRRTVHALCPPHRWPRGAPASADSPRGVVACLASYVASAILAFNRLQTSMKTERGTAQLTAAVQACPTKQQATLATPPGPSDATVLFRVLILSSPAGCVMARVLSNRPSTTSHLSHYPQHLRRQCTHSTDCAVHAPCTLFTKLLVDGAYKQRRRCGGSFIGRAWSRALSCGRVRSTDAPRAHAAWRRRPRPHD